MVSPKCRKGIEYNIKQVVEWYKAIRHYFGSKGITLTGGLGPLNIKQKIEELSDSLQTIQFNIDAEERLRTKKDELLTFKARKYFRDATKTFYKNNNY